MAKKKPAKRQPRTTDSAKYDFVQFCMKTIKARVAAGCYRDNPGLEAALSNDPDPAIVMYELMCDPQNDPNMRGAIAARLLPYVHKEQSLLLKDGAEGQGGRVSVQVTIAAWAAKNGGESPQLQPPKPAERAVEVDYVKSDRALESDAPRSSKPAPPPDQDPAQKIVAYTRFGAAVSARRLEELKRMGSDISGLVYPQPGMSTRPSQDGLVHPGRGSDDSDRDRERYRQMCRETGKLQAPGEGTVKTSFKLFDD